MRKLLPIGLALLCLCLLSPVAARAFVAQTIVLDGHNDFDASNLIKDDRYDTQQFCTPLVYPLDIGRAYVTNDANYLYFGIELAQTCFCNMNLGVAIDVNTAGGGTTDPFNRQIGWLNVTYKPDFVVYDVIPVSCNSYNYEAFYKDSSGTWLNKSTLVNPAYGAGANGLGIVDSTSFREFRLPLSVLGLSSGTATPLHLEMWTVQDGSTKGPMDCLMSDDVQMGTATSTTWDTPTIIQMTHQFTYTVQSAIDTIPPTVATVAAGGFATLANGTFSALTNKVDVTFSENVDQTTAETKANYTFSGPVARTISAAAQDGAAKNVVHLTLSSPITANAAAFSISVQNVKDLANNAIVNNGTTNANSFYIQSVTFNGDFRLGLCNGAFAVTDTFAVEGSQTPLDFVIGNNALMSDANSDSIYTTVVPFVIPHVRGTARDTLQLNWKFSNTHIGNMQFEPLAGNRYYLVDAANGATATVSAVWNNDDPSKYTSHPVDVLFQVNAALHNPTGSDVITLLGNAAPMRAGFAQPGLTMYDDGTHGDLVSGDKIYSLRVTFPSCSKKDVEWKVDFNGTYECLGQGNRTVYLNDALYSSTTPIIMPARGIERCTVSDKPVTVVFKVNMQPIFPLPASADTVAVRGSVLPLTWGWPPAGPVIMADDGAGYDTRAHDGIFTRAVTFPDSTNLAVEFKYDFKWVGASVDSIECPSYPARKLTLDDVSGTTTVRLVNPFDYCSDPATVLPTPQVNHGTAFGALRPVMPNPVARKASFSFELYRAGHVTFSVYDVTGRRVARLVDGTMGVGIHTLTWTGQSDAGLRLASGVYMYEVAMGANRLSRRMILVH